MITPAGYTSRPATAEDLDAVVEVFKACDRADVGFEDPVREHIEDDWRRTTCDLALDSLLVFAADGELAAYGSVEGLFPQAYQESFGRVHPDHRGRGLGEALVGWAEARAGERSPGVPTFRNSVPSEDPVAHDLLEFLGYAMVRTFWHMERDLAAAMEPVDDPPGVHLRPYDHATDVRSLYDAFEEAFVDEWGSEPYPYETHEEDLARSEPGLAIVATDGDELVGGAVARLVEDAGWIDVVGVRRAWRRRGIAHGLLLRSFAVLAGHGAETATLNVDSENPTGAPGVYTSAGMHVHRAWHVFEKQLDAGIS